ncbi:hypothetical protein [Salinicoccus sp. YB14-2]|uniref:hypothetical protein n=1 Tax=Salinicoccus sp. YB14-2 TaxID=1572701 RepID=UPI00068D4C70|nr:hypothetical protein [Salinicoccus sp. YB14-2]
MKNSLKNLILLTSIVLLLSACSSTDNDTKGEDIVNEEDTSENDQTNLIDMEELVEGKWIDTKGIEQSNPKMLQTEPIGYTSNNSYILNGHAYVSYYKDGEFIKTNRYSGTVSDLPFTLEEVNEADTILLSFHEQWSESISLIKE